ncbi:DUF2730 domain-containing protein [Plesiomonas shigelloides]|uniref:DUF2730 family protein n=1 Tax=Plesiomonas shigelloides TaxID=703 RepID=UPI000D1352CD|nr:DUF2730 family protein [Plesiomonas shigelloides]AVQ86200.1 DUF2730 domain-containing protein [Plesiomonas shigelloides]
MEFDWIPKWWGVITTIAALGMTVAMLWLSKTFARREEIKVIETSMDELNSRVDSLENHINTLPTQQEFSHLSMQMESVRGDMKALTAQLKQTNHLNNLLLEQRLNEK